MHAPKRKRRSERISDLCLSASQFLLVFVVSIVPLAAMDLSVKASEKAGGDRPGQASVKADEPEAGSRNLHPELQTMLWATTAWLRAIV